MSAAICVLFASSHPQSLVTYFSAFPYLSWCSRNFSTKQNKSQSPSASWVNSGGWGEQWVNWRGLGIQSCSMDSLHSDLTKSADTNQNSLCGLLNHDTAFLVRQPFPLWAASFQCSISSIKIYWKAWAHIWFLLTRLLGWNCLKRENTSTKKRISHSGTASGEIIWEREAGIKCR